jgi:hypothetical protein
MIDSILSIFHNKANKGTRIDIAGKLTDEVFELLLVLWIGAEFIRDRLLIEDGVLTQDVVKPDLVVGLFT